MPRASRFQPVPMGLNVLQVAQFLVIPPPMN
jgi:hypothetical protein